MVFGKTKDGGEGCGRGTCAFLCTIFEIEVRAKELMKVSELVPFMFIIDIRV